MGNRIRGMTDIQKRAIKFADAFARTLIVDLEVRKADRDDVIQEARMAALIRLEAYDPDRGALLEEWLRPRIWQYVQIFLSKARSGGVTEIPDAENFYMTGLEDDQDVVDEAEEEEDHFCEIRELLPAAMATLPKKQREVLRRYYGFSGEPVTQEQLADERGITRLPVKRMIDRAHKNLRNIFIRGGTFTEGSLNPIVGGQDKMKTGTQQISIEEQEEMQSLFANMCEKAGYPESAYSRRSGKHARRNGPGTLSTYSNEWLSDSRFWKPSRLAARLRAAREYAAERAAFLISNSAESHSMRRVLADQMEGWNADDLSTTEFFLRQSESAS